MAFYAGSLVTTGSAAAFVVSSRSGARSVIFLIHSQRSTRDSPLVRRNRSALVPSRGLARDARKIPRQQCIDLFIQIVQLHDEVALGQARYALHTYQQAPCRANTESSHSPTESHTHQDDSTIDSLDPALVRCRRRIRSKVVIDAMWKIPARRYSGSFAIRDSGNR